MRYTIDPDRTNIPELLALISRYKSGNKCEREMSTKLELIIERGIETDSAATYCTKSLYVRHQGVQDVKIYLIRHDNCDI